MIPISDSPRNYTTPWVNYGLIVANIVVLLLMLRLDTSLPVTRRQALSEFQGQTAGECYGFETAPTEADRFYCRWGFQPREFFDTVRGDNPAPADERRQALLSIITATFLHGGLLHIIGNMLFLWVFGDNVEDRLGHLKYVIFYMASGIVASLVQAFVDVDSVVPVVGASGAIAGVLGAYLVSYPRATVNVVIPFFILIFIPIPVPAVLMIGLWFLQNLWAGALSIGSATTVDSSVAWFAHIGGFVFGMLVTWAFYGGARRTSGGSRRHA